MSQTASRSLFAPVHAALSGVAATIGTGLLLVACATSACESGGPSNRQTRADRDPEANAPYQADIEEGLGAAVAILVDTSGSMKDNAPGDTRAKYTIARESLESMLEATDAFARKRPDFPIKIGLYSFSSNVRVLLPMQTYNKQAVRVALSGLPRPGGGTAIGDALREARPELYRSGVFRKYLLVVTDGENTTGSDPEKVTREIWHKSDGAVQVYFVAFDTDPEKFAFLKKAGGDVIGAGTGGELKTALDGIYQGKILAEAPDAGEREPVSH